MHLFFFSLITTTLVVLPDSYAYADRKGGDRKDHDRGKRWDKIWKNSSKESHQGTIRRAVQQKKILPLGEIKRIVEKKTKSEIIKIELERKKRRWVYEFKIVDQQGRLREVYVDASNGIILKTKYK
jgi:uncharacterized membrane protein YkoI